MTKAEPELCDLCGNPRSWHEGKNAARRGVHTFVARSVARFAGLDSALHPPKVAPSPQALEFARGFFVSGILFRLDEIAAMAGKYDPAMDPPVLAALASALDGFAELRLDAARALDRGAASGPITDEARHVALSAMNLILDQKVGGEGQILEDLEPMDVAIVEEIAESIQIYSNSCHVFAMNAAQNLLATLHRDGGHHSHAVGFVQACKDAQERYYGLVREIDELRTAAGLWRKAERPEDPEES